MKTSWVIVKAYGDHPVAVFRHKAKVRKFLKKWAEDAKHMHSPLIIYRLPGRNMYVPAELL